MVVGHDASAAWQSIRYKLIRSALDVLSGKEEIPSVLVDGARIYPGIRLIVRVVLILFF